jgi:hypothetical protein
VLLWLCAISGANAEETSFFKSVSVQPLSPCLPRLSSLNSWSFLTFCHSVARRDLTFTLPSSKSKKAIQRS